MDQQNSTPSNVSNKRKRGRPRKEQSGVQGKNMLAMAGSANVLNSNQLARTTDDYDEIQPQMVGKMTLGVIEGTFDGGYLIKVQVGDSDLRGAVFLPGRVLPITTENDVAPDFSIIERTDMPIPVLNPESRVKKSVGSSRRRNKRPVKPELQVPMAINQEDGQQNPLLMEEQKKTEKTYEIINLISIAENTKKELGTGQQSVPSMHKVNELIPDGPSCSN